MFKMTKDNVIFQFSDGSECEHVLKWNGIRVLQRSYERIYFYFHGIERPYEISFKDSEEAKQNLLMMLNQVAKKS